jgi:hypothetical protein
MFDSLAGTAIGGMLLVGSIAFGSSRLCPAISSEALIRDVEEAGDIELIFFASWCSSCAENLAKGPSHRHLYVAAFDEPGLADEVARKFGLGKACRFDTDVAKRLGVSSLPARKWVRKSELNALKAQSKGRS